MTATNDKSTIVLLSGGLDSALALGLAEKSMNVRLALFADYGQRAARAEEHAAKAIAKHYGVKFQAIALPWLSSLGNSALTNDNNDVPAFDTEKFTDLDYQNDTAKAVWVPNRNGLLFNAAACFAEALECEFISAGLNAEEGATFKDNTPDFVSAVENSFSWSTQNNVKVLDLLSGLTKNKIVKRGLEIDLPFELVHSCYFNREKMCGNCESCARSIRAYKNCGLWPRMQTRFEEQ